MQRFTLKNVTTGLLLITASHALHANVSMVSAVEDSASPPNIVFLFADDQCTYSVGCYGNSDVRTPNMDQLARDGVVFDKHYNTTAICMASRANVFTGMYEYKTGCNFWSWKYAGRCVGKILSRAVAQGWIPHCFCRQVWDRGPRQGDFAKTTSSSGAAVLVKRITRRRRTSRC